MPNHFRIDYIRLDSPDEEPYPGFVEFEADMLDRNMVDVEIQVLRELGINVLGVSGIWQVIDFKNPTYSTN